MWRLTGKLLHLAVQVYAADAHGGGYRVDTQVAVRDVLVDDLHDALEELLVGRFHFYLLHLALQLVVAAVFQSQHAT